MTNVSMTDVRPRAKGFLLITFLSTRDLAATNCEIWVFCRGGGVIMLAASLARVHSA